MEKLKMNHNVTFLSRRETTLRSAATTCLTGIALIEAIYVPALWARGEQQLAVVSMAAVALCVVVAWALAMARAGSPAGLWCAVGATGALALTGWAASHASASSRLAGALGGWAELPGGIAALLAALSLAVAVKAAAPRAASHVLACAGVVVLLTLQPIAGAMRDSVGPGTTGGASVHASGGHVHSGASFDNSIVYQPIAGGKGGHYVVKAPPAAPHRTPLGLAVLIGTAALFAGALVGSLRRRGTIAGAERVAFDGGVEVSPA